jgi:predicted nuclease with RNAse H fold
MLCGIDLAGSEKRPTGVCILSEDPLFYTLYSNEEILSLVNKKAPSLVAIDAPLSFYGEHFRDGDRELRREFPILPLTFKGMQSLSRRGIALTSLLPFPVIEVYPHASKKALGITAAEDLVQYGFSNLPSTIHELDAAAAALTAQYYIQGKYKKYGKKDVIIVPL